MDGFHHRQHSRRCTLQNDPHHAFSRTLLPSANVPSFVYTERAPWSPPPVLSPFPSGVVTELRPALGSSGTQLVCKLIRQLTSQNSLRSHASVTAQLLSISTSTSIGTRSGWSVSR